MKTTVETVNPVQKRINVAIDKDAVKKAFNTVYQSMAREAHLKGFRPGKAPISLIRQVYKPLATEKVMEKLLKENLFSAIEQEKLSMISTPVVEKVGSLDEEQEFHFDALVDIYPEFELPDLGQVSVSYKEFKKTDELVKEIIDDTLRNFATTKSLPDGERPTQGNLIYCSQKAFKMDNSGEESELEELRFTHQPIELNGEQLLPEVEKAFFEMAPGDKKSVTMNLPEDYPEADLAGKGIRMDVELHGVYELEIPELDDELAKKAGIETAQQLRENINRNVEMRLENMTRSDKELKVLEKLRELCNFDVPPSVVDKSIDDIVYEYYGSQVKDEASMHKLMQNKQLRENLKGEAKARAARSLILLQVLKKYDLKVEDADFDEVLSSSAYHFKNDYDKKQFLKKHRNTLADQILMRKAMETIFSQSAISPLETQVRTFRQPMGAEA